MYETEGESSRFRPRVWRLSGVRDEVAVFRRKFAWFRTAWDVQSELGNFEVRFLPERRPCYKVVGGSFDGAELRSSLSDREWELSHLDTVVARSSGQFNTAADLHDPDRHDIELVQQDERESLLLTVIVLSLLQTHRAEAADSCV
jgi:hypothetical protein